jgi:uncharacterized protein (TIGR02145 family)
VGWHIPSQAEWRRLIDTLLDPNSVDTTLLSRSGWVRFTGTDVVGFRALPAAFCVSGACADIGYDLNFWSASETEGSPGAAWGRTKFQGMSSLKTDTDFDKNMEFSIRCLQD